MHSFDIHLNRELLYAYVGDKSEADSVSYTAEVPPSHLIRVIEGALWMGKPGQLLKVVPGQWAMSPPGPRQQWFAPGTRILSIGFLARWPHGVNLLTAPGGILFAPEVGNHWEASAYRLLRAVESCVGEGADWLEARRWQEKANLPHYLLIQGRFLEWLEHILSACLDANLDASDFQIHLSMTQDSRVEKAVAFIEEWSGDRNLQTVDVAAAIGVSKDRLDQLFKEALGMTVHGYREGIQLKQVCSALLDPSRQVKEISFSVGFTQSSNFTRWFRRKMGMSPAEYRAAER